MYLARYYQSDKYYIPVLSSTIRYYNDYRKLSPSYVFNNRTLIISETLLLHVSTLPFPTYEYFAL